MSFRRIKVATIAELKEGSAVKFEYEKGVEGFVICWRGKLYAYRNTCRHMTLPLDYGDGRFFSDNGRLLVCSNHGAQYEPDTGLCVRGPCSGRSLEALPVSRDKQDILIELR